MDRFIVFALAAATQVLSDAGWSPKTEEQQERTGVMVGPGIGGLLGIYESSVRLKEGGPAKSAPF